MADVALRPVRGPQILTRQWLQKIVAAFKGAPVIPVVILLTVALTGALADVISPHDPVVTDLSKRLLPPAWEDGGTWEHPLGTDYVGRDVLSRILHGSRTSLVVGFSVIFIAGAIGTLLALLSGYIGGYLDRIIMRTTDAVIALLFLVVALALAAILQPSLLNIILILGLLGWAGYARILTR